MLSAVSPCRFLHPTICALINISTGVYTLCSFTWRSAWGEGTQLEFPLKNTHPSHTSPWPCSEPGVLLPWMTCVLLHGPEADIRGQDICAGNSRGGWNKGVATPSVTAEAEGRMGRELVFWDPAKINSTKGGKWKKYVDAHLAPNLLHYLWPVFFLLGSREVSDYWLL